tara:strand:+ start:4343 stop:5686 length:1344 start_codon:yes stop_codon:yes gene_type:complete
MNKKRKITILGGGPAGMGTAYYCYKGNIPYSLFEMDSEVGGNCKTFKKTVFRYDSGAHRFHDKDSQTTHDIKKIMGEKLIKIEVPSQIYLNKQFIDFPLSPWNLFKFLGFQNSIIEFIKLIIFKIKNFNKKINNFEEFAYNTYGEKLASLFLIGYSEKLWGLPCKNLSTEIAGKRLRGLNLSTLILEIFQLKNKKTQHLDGEFYYPQDGIGSIFTEIKLQTNCNNYFLNHKITKIKHNNGLIESIQSDGIKNHTVDYLVSSLSLDILAELMDPQIPKPIYNAIKSIRYRDIILVTFFLNKKNINKNGSMYFPSSNFHFTRIYEAKNRSPKMSPENQTSLSVEIPTYHSSNLWDSPTDKIKEIITNELLGLDFFDSKEIIDIEVKKINKAYPILDTNYKSKISLIQDYFSKFRNLTINGRNGKFQYTHIHDHFLDARNIIENLKNNFI